VVVLVVVVVVVVIAVVVLHKTIIVTLKSHVIIPLLILTSPGSNPFMSGNNLENAITTCSSQDCHALFLSPPYRGVGCKSEEDHLLHRGNAGHHHQQHHLQENKAGFLGKGRANRLLANNINKHFLLSSQNQTLQPYTSLVPLLLSPPPQPHKLPYLLYIPLLPPPPFLHYPLKLKEVLPDKGPKVIILPSYLVLSFPLLLSCSTTTIHIHGDSGSGGGLCASYTLYDIAMAFVWSFRHSAPS